MNQHVRMPKFIIQVCKEILLVYLYTTGFAILELCLQKKINSLEVLL